MPSDRPTDPPTPVRFGPITTPIVVAQTTSASDRAILLGSAASVAAYRDCRFDAEPLPNRQPAASNSASEPICAATIVSTAPMHARRYPVASDTRRPLDRASPASGTARIAAPSVVDVATSPASEVEPDTFSASSAATANPLA